MEYVPQKFIVNPQNFPSLGTPKIPKRYKRNTINGDLNRAYRISSSFDNEKDIIRNKFQKANYPILFINSVINQFESRKTITTQSDIEDEFIVPPNFFEPPEALILIVLPFCESNEVSVKKFITKFHTFTRDMYDVRIKWNAKKVRQLFKLKIKYLSFL